MINAWGGAADAHFQVGRQKTIDRELGLDFDCLALRTLDQTGNIRAKSGELLSNVLPIILMKYALILPKLKTLRACVNMLSSSWCLFASSLQAFRIRELPGKISSPLYFLVLSISLLLLWRLWRFSLSPHLWPQAPKELPYWVPCKTYR